MCGGIVCAHLGIFNLQGAAARVDVGSVEGSFGPLCTLHRVKRGARESRNRQDKREQGHGLGHVQLLNTSSFKNTLLLPVFIYIATV